MNSLIFFEYMKRFTERSDINEHIPTLKKYADECNHVTECGVSNVNSTYAFAESFRIRSNNKIVMIDIKEDPNINIFIESCKNEGVNVVFHNQGSLSCPIEHTDLLFIDTWHVYGQLKRELGRWNKYVNKYIIMHDTTIDEWLGETIRDRHNAEQQSKDTGIPIEEINKGLWPAIEEFLKIHPEWIIKERYYNNNGLTILQRV